MTLEPVHQGPAVEPRWQGLAREGFATMPVHPVVESAHIAIGGGGQEKSPRRGGAAAPLLQHPLLPVQKDLVVLQHPMVAEMLQPEGPQPQQQGRKPGFKPEGKAGD